MDSQAIRKCIGVEEATEMGHMKQTQQGIKSTTIKSRRVRPAKITQQSDRTNAMHDAISVPTQEPKNMKKYGVYVGTATRRIHCKQPDRIIPPDVKQRHALNLRVIHSQS